MVTTTAPIHIDASPWHVPPAVAPELFHAIRRETILEHCKWDPQVGDVSTLAPFPLILCETVWRQLSRWSEQLTVEALAAEQELLHRPDLQKRLAVPRAIRRVFKQGAALGITPAVARVMRFDFHLTREGWRISEVNSDVPGGFSESSSFTSLMAGHYPEARMAGTPIMPLIDALQHAAGSGGAVGLLCAPGFMEDQQIMAYAARRLQARGCTAFLANPQQLEWRGGHAHLESAFYRGSLSAMVRFYQAEWLARLPARYEWSHFFCGGRTPVTNPGISVLSESKRFPLVWDELHSPLSTWRKLLPETRDPRIVPWRDSDEWIVKSAYCNTGDTVGSRVLLPKKEWRSLARSAFWQPAQWVAQRRFEPIPVETPWGMMYPCLGVYTIDGRVAGAYARIAPGPVINFEAIDIALLVSNETI